jgi:glycerol-3-phosphate cytidylyltransferase
MNKIEQPIIKNIITFGTFDLFHIGHLNILKRAKALGDRLIVGVSTDELNFSKKNIKPIYNQEMRLAIVSSIKYVDGVFLEESLEKKREYIKLFNAHVLVMGEDWKGKFDDLKDICKVVYFPRTKGISSTELKNNIHNYIQELKETLK